MMMMMMMMTLSHFANFMQFHITSGPWTCPWTFSTPLCLRSRWSDVRQPNAVL